MTVPAPDQDAGQGQAVDPATGQISADVLDAVIDQTDQRRADRKAEAERAKAPGGPCRFCGARESWLRPGKGGWHRDDRGPVCHPCDLDRRSFRRPDGAILPDSEVRVRAARQVLGTTPSPAWAGTGDRPAQDFWHDGYLAAAWRWFHETPQAQPGDGPQRFAYTSAAELLARLYEPSTPRPAKRYSRGRRHRCAGCGCKGDCWTVEQVGVPAAMTSTGELSTVQRAHFRVTWRCAKCRHEDVERLADQLPDVPVRLATG